MWSLAGGNFEERGALCSCVIGLVSMHSQTSILPSEGFSYLQISECFLAGVSHFSGGQSGEHPPPTGALQEQPGWRHWPQCPALSAAASIAPCRAQTWGRHLPRWDSACSRGTSTVQTQERPHVFGGVALGNPRAKQVTPVKVRLGGAGGHPQPAPQCWSGITPSPSPRRAVLQSRDTSPVTTCSISPSQALLSPGTSWHSIDAVHQLTELIAQQGLCSPGEHQPLSSAFPTTVVVGLSHTRWCQLSAVWGAAEPRGVDAHTVPRLPPRLPWSTSRVVPQQDQAVTPSGGDTSALAGHFAENGQKLKRESAGLRG